MLHWQEASWQGSEKLAASRSPGAGGEFAARTGGIRASEKYAFKARRSK